MNSKVVHALIRFEYGIYIAQCRNYGNIMISLMQWPPEDSQGHAWLPEPGTATEWTEGGFETLFARAIDPPFLIQKPVRGFYIKGRRFELGDVVCSSPKL